jgi:hypothetical protein
MMAWTWLLWAWLTLKCTGMIPHPRFIISQAATGESIPLDSNATTLPWLPKGNPPGPGIVWPKTRTRSVRTSTPMSTSASLDRSTPAPVACTMASPTRRSISGEM